MSNLETIGWAITCIAVAGVMLNNRRHRACFALWLVSNALSACVHAEAEMYALAVRDAIFFALAIHGWFAWRKTDLSADCAEHRRFKNNGKRGRPLKVGVGTRV